LTRTVELAIVEIVSCNNNCFIADKEILGVFTSFNDLEIEPVADKPPSIIIVGGPCSSRVAVTNRLLGSDVLPQPRANTEWHTLQFVDTECVSSFNAVDTASVITLWSWFGTVPLSNIELDSDQSYVHASKVVAAECKRTAPVVNVLTSHAVLRAGSQVVVCGDCSSVDSIHFLVADVIPIIVFVVSGDELSEQVCTLVIITHSSYVGRRYCDQTCLLVGWFVCSLTTFFVMFSKSKSPDFREIWHRCLASVLNVTNNFSEVKVKLQGHNPSTEDLLLVIARLWFMISSLNLHPTLRPHIAGAPSATLATGTPVRRLQGGQTCTPVAVWHVTTVPGRRLPSCRCCRCS